MEVLRKYNVATAILFPLVDAGAADFESTPVTFAAGDSQISKDEGAFANTSNNPSHEGNGIYSLSLTATEMQAGRVVITIIDQTATKTWEDQAIIISTYGNASAQHAFDLDSATVNLSSATESQIDAIETDTNALNDTKIPDTISLANINAEADTALSDYDAPTKAELDAGLAGLNDPSAADVADAVWDEARAGHTASGSFGQEVQQHALSSEIAALNDLSAAQVNSEVDTALAGIHLDHLLAVDYDPASKPGAATALLNELIENDGGVSRYTANALEQAPSGGGSVPTAAEVADAVWEEATADHVAAGSFGEHVGSLPSPVAGATEWSNILVDDGTNPVEGAELWLSTDAAGSNVVWAGTTDAFGAPKDAGGLNPFVDAGTYYIWVQHSGYTFSNPVSETAGVAETISGTAVSSPSSVLVSAIIDQIQIDLNDAAAAIWPEVNLLQWLNDAVRDYSLNAPRRRTGTITAVSGQHKYDLPDDHLETLSVEFPTGSSPPTYLIQHSYTHLDFWSDDSHFDVLRNNDQDVDDELWISVSPTSGTITIEYLAWHPHSLQTTDFVSVPSEHHHILRIYVLARATEWLQMTEQAAPTNNASLLMSMLADNAKQLRGEYEQRKSESNGRNQSRGNGR